jgi:hypothetical protein
MSDPNIMRLVFLGAALFIWLVYIAGNEETYPPEEKP